MDEAEKEIEQKEAKIISWLKKPYNFALAGILIAALAIRVYYFWVTKNQALWWDALSYGSLANNFITSAWSHLDFIQGELAIRPLLMPYLWSILLRLNFSEIMVNIFLGFIPSVLTVFFVYLAAKKLYSERVALITAFIFAISWIHIFYTYRLLTGIPALFLSAISIYYFFKSLDGEKISAKYFAISIFCLFIAFFFRYNLSLLGFCYLIFLIATKKLEFLKQKSFWIGGIIGSIPILAFFSWNLIKYGKIFPAMGIYAASAGGKDLAFYSLQFFSHILQSPLIFLLIIGAAIVLFRLVLGFDMIGKSKEMNSNFFIILMILANLVFLVGYIRYSEDRYFMEFMLSFVLLVALSIEYIYSFIKKQSRIIAIIFVVVILLWASYSQFKFGDDMINSKKDSFKEMRSSFLWLHDNSPKDAVILGEGIAPYAIYYADRMPAEFGDKSNQEKLKNNSLDFDYIVVNRFSGQSENFTRYVDSLSSNLIQVKVEMFNKDEWAVVVLKLNK